MTRLRINSILVSIILILLVGVSVGYSALTSNLVVIGTSDFVSYTGSNPCTYTGTLSRGATYTNGDYTYKFMQEKSSSSWTNITPFGWGVALTDTSQS